MKVNKNPNIWILWAKFKFQDILHENNDLNNLLHVFEMRLWHEYQDKQKQAEIMVYITYYTSGNSTAALDSMMVKMNVTTGHNKQMA